MNPMPVQHPTHRPTNRLAHILAAAALAVMSGLAGAQNVGWRSIEVPAGEVLDEPTTVALYYPTAASPRTVPMGPFRVEAAINAEPLEHARGLLLFSHGLGGSEIGQGRIAEALARRGWIVAVLRHPHDNWRDHALIGEGPSRYFVLRPRQASAVLDALLADPAVAPRIAKDAHGPRIGAIGHSAGGYTVLALAGGELDVPRLVHHCADERAEDPIFCASGAQARPAAPSGAPGSLRDARVRAVAALAPVGVPFSDTSLAGISIPVSVYAGRYDTFLVPRFHGERVAKAIPTAQWHLVDEATHFAFMDTPGMPIPSPDGDIGLDRPGFDRAAFQARLAVELDTFFAGALGEGAPRENGGAAN